MLGAKGILMGANSQSPALNDFAKLVAMRIDDNFSCREVAVAVMETSFALKRGELTAGDEYAALRAYIADGGNMYQFAAQIAPIPSAASANNSNNVVLNQITLFIFMLKI